MPTKPLKTTVSVIFAYDEQLPGGVPAARELLASIAAQDVPVSEVLVADRRGPDAAADLLAPDAELPNFRHLPGAYANRAAAQQAALGAATGEYILLITGEQGAVTLQRSAVQTLLMAGQRNDGVAFIYSDYARRAADGTLKDVHLLDWHAGRLRDTVDFGSVWLVNAAVLRAAGGFNASFKTADAYDLRLRLSAAGRVLHIANRYSGSLYTVTAPDQAHNVFAYLLADRASQVELEQACTAHLERIGAYLAPGAHTQPVAYSAAEAAAVKDCVASVVTPVNNRPQFIGRAIESVQAQTVQAVEMVVVVNGGPDDPTIPEVQRYLPGGDKHDAAKPPVQLIVVDVNNLGLCLNAGLQAAKGKYYVQLDSDDRLKPDAVEKIAAVFDSDPTVGMVVGSYEVWTLDEKTSQLNRNEEIPVVTHEEWTADNGRNNLLRINGAGAPRAAHIKAIADAGWFGVNDTPQCRNYGEDYDLVLRTSERYTIGRVWEPIYEVIRHSGGTDHAIDQATVDRNDNAKDAMRLEAIERRQRLNGKH